MATLLLKIRLDHDREVRALSYIGTQERIGGAPALPALHIHLSMADALLVLTVDVVVARDTDAHRRIDVRIADVVLHLDVRHIQLTALGVILIGGP